MPSGQPLAVAWIQVRADSSRLGGDVQESAQRVATRASDTVKTGLTEGVRNGTRAAQGEAERGGTAIAGALGNKLRDPQGQLVKGAEEGGRHAGTAAGKAVNDHADRQIKSGSSRLGATLKGGLMTSIGALAAGFVGLGAIEVFSGFISGARESAKVGALTAQVIKTTGGAAHVTADQVGDLATAISNKTGVDDEAIQSGANLLLTFTGIRNEVGKGNDIFNQATSIITDMSVALGQDLKSSSIQVGKALNDPIRGVSALQKVGVSFTESQKEQIKTLVATGHTMEAQKIILAELGREFGGAAAAAGTPMDKLRVRVGNLAESIGTRLLPTIDKVATLFGDYIVPAVGAVADALGSIPAPMYAAIAAFVAARVAIGLFGKALEGIGSRGGVAATLRGSLSGLVGFLGGPLGIALGAAAIAVGIWAAKNQESKERLNELTDAIRADKGALDSNTRAKIANRLESDGLLAIAERLGVSFTDITDAALGNAGAQARVNAKLLEYRHVSEGLEEAGGEFLSQNESDAVKLSLALKDTNSELGQARASFLRESAAAAESAETTRAKTRATQISTLQTKLNTAQSEYNKAASTAATDALNLWITALQKQQNQFLGLRGAQRDYREAVDAATKASKSSTAGLSINTSAGRANQGMLDNVASSAGRVLDQLVKNNARGPAIRTEWDRQRDQLYRVARQFGLNETAARDYVNKALGKVPPSVSTKVTTPGLDKAKQDIRNLGVQIQALKSKNLEVRIDSRGNAILRDSNAGGKASGGLITGAGTPTGDSITARVSPGEFIVNAEQTKRHMALLQAINGARVPSQRDGDAPGYAAGGVVRDLRVGVDANTPRNLTSNILRMIDPNAIFAAGGGSAVGNVGSGVRRWAPLVLRALAMMGQSPGLLGTTLNRMNRESGGNPNAINNWDINALNGDPSRGLMQTIMGTFRAFHFPGTSWNIYDPLANILASMKYAISRYGSLARAYNQPGGYDAGGEATGIGLMAKATVKPERVLSPVQTEAFNDWMRGRTQGQAAMPPIVHVYIGDEEITGRVRVEVEDAFDSFGRRFDYGYGQQVG